MSMMLAIQCWSRLNARSTNCVLHSVRQHYGLNILAPWHYIENSYFTGSLQYVIEGVHTLGVPWFGTFVLSGFIFRLATLPLNVYAEKLSAERFHTVGILKRELLRDALNIPLQKYSRHYGLNLVMSKDGRRCVLDTTDKAILKKTNEMTEEIILDVCWKHRLQLTRIQYLRLSSVPVWLFSSFAIRNVISTALQPCFSGALWLTDLLQPDPYYVLPVTVGFFSLLNYYCLRRVYAFQSGLMSYGLHAAYTLLVIIGVYFMSGLPACIPLFWATVSFSGFLQFLAFRHPKIKKIIGVRPLPSDSNTPFRDLFNLNLIWQKTVQKAAPSNVP